MLVLLLVWYCNTKYTMSVPTHGGQYLGLFNSSLAPCLTMARASWTSADIDRLIEEVEEAYRSMYHACQSLATEATSLPVSRLDYTFVAQ